MASKASRDLLPAAPLAGVPKAPRSENRPAPAGDSPSSSQAPTAPAAAAPRATSENRLGPGKTRKSFYMSADVATRLSAEVNRIHHQSGGRFAKNDVLDAIISAGLSRLDEVQQHLETNNPAA